MPVLQTVISQRVIFEMQRDPESHWQGRDPVTWSNGQKRAIQEGYRAFQGEYPGLSMREFIAHSQATWRTENMTLEECPTLEEALDDFQRMVSEYENRGLSM